MPLFTGNNRLGTKLDGPCLTQAPAAWAHSLVQSSKGTRPSGDSSSSKIQNLPRIMDAGSAKIAQGAVVALTQSHVHLRFPIKGHPQ